MNVWACHYRAHYILRGLISSDCSRWAESGRQIFSCPTTNPFCKSYPCGTSPFIVLTDTWVPLPRPTRQRLAAAVLIPSSFPSPTTSTPAKSPPLTTSLSCLRPAPKSKREKKDRGGPKTLTPPIPPPEIGIPPRRRRRHGHGSDERPGEVVLLRAGVQERRGRLRPEPPRR